MYLACWQPEARRGSLLEGLAAAADGAAAAGADLLVAPELALTGYPLRFGAARRVAEAEDGPLNRAVAGIARASGLAIAYGWPEAAAGVVHNSATLVDATGARLATYRKTHLYGEVEKHEFVPGSDPVVRAELGGVSVGLLICFDVEFPETVRLHALAGTELLVVPTALARPAEFVAETLVPARAMESQLYIAYPNWTGRDGDVDYCGLSCLAGPDGRVVRVPSSGEELLIAQVDTGVIAAARLETPYLRDRRPELYRALLEEPSAGRTALVTKAST